MLLYTLFILVAKCNDSMGEKISNTDSLNTTILQNGGPYRMLLPNPCSSCINTNSAVHHFRYTTVAKLENLKIKFPLHFMIYGHSTARTILRTFETLHVPINHEFICGTRVLYNLVYLFFDIYYTRSHAFTIVNIEMRSP